MRLWLPATAATAILAANVLAPPAPRAAAPAKRFSAYDGQVAPILAKMTLAEKVGQMTQPDQQYIKDLSDVETMAFGSVLSGGDSDPKTNSFEDWRDMYERFQSRTAKSRLKIPILYGVDAVHGHNNVIGAVVFPHNVALGATRDAKLVEEIARITAKEVRATGINWAFSPCVTVPQDERWGRTYEGFSEDPKLVAELGAAAVRGMQGADLKDPLRVLACAKHYVGDGGTTWGTGTAKWEVPGKPFGVDQGDTRLTEAELRRIHLPGYPAAIEAGVGSIMPSYSSWNGVKCSGSKRLLTEILKGELGFEGFLISDYNALDQLGGDFRSNIKTSINAGMDMVMVPEKYKEFYGDLKDLAEKGEVPMTRIDDAVTRILRVKAAMGLLDETPRSPLADRGLEKSFGSPEHREVARRAVRESLVLLKNDKKTLPLAKTAARIHVAGKNADDIGNQMGGWSITWQGKSGATTTGGTTILTAIKSAASKATSVTFSKDGTGAAGATVGVVVVGETPYAEMRGDREDLGLDKEDKEAIANVKKAGIPVVVVLLSGRPMIITDVLPEADAFVAAWLPGTEGQGVADVLFGDYKPTGKLAHTWPRSMAQIPINLGDGKDPLFAFGYGLTY
jgi:beta-glucosidase